MSKDKRHKSSKSKVELPEDLKRVNLNAAGIDVGSKSHFVAVPQGRDTESVREFKGFTSDLYELTAWLKRCGIKTVAMESTGVYWIPVYEILEDKGFEVCLVNGRNTKHVSGRKTDVLDCQWLQQLHTYGLLSASFRPKNEICELRVYLRQREMLVQSTSSQMLRMQKALTQMNIQLHNVISDIAGETGLRIVRAIADGEYDPKVLARYRDGRCRSGIAVIEESLKGHYRKEHVFALKQALELYDVYQQKIADCDQEIKSWLERFNKDSGTKETVERPFKAKRNKLNFDLKVYLNRLTGGIDLTLIPGIESLTALKVISEVGIDLSAWKTEKQFTAWLALSPNNRVSGGKRLSGRTKPSASRAAAAFRVAATAVQRTSTALGAYLRRLKSRIGPAKAITATARKLAVLFYKMLKHGVEYVEAGQDYYERQYKDRVVKSLERRAKDLGYTLVESPTGAIS